MSNVSKLAQAQRAWNDGECEQALEILLDYAEGRATATIPESDDDEALFDDLFCEVMAATNATMAGAS